MGHSHLNIFGTWSFPWIFPVSLDWWLYTNCPGYKNIKASWWKLCFLHNNEVSSSSASVAIECVKLPSHKIWKQVSRIAGNQARDKTWRDEQQQIIHMFEEETGGVCFHALCHLMERRYTDPPHTHTHTHTHTLVLGLTAWHVKTGYLRSHVGMLIRMWLQLRVCVCVRVCAPAAGDVCYHFVCLVNAAIKSWYKLLGWFRRTNAPNKLLLYLVGDIRAAKRSAHLLTGESLQFVSSFHRVQGRVSWVLLSEHFIFMSGSVHPWLMAHSSRLAFWLISSWPQAEGVRFRKPAHLFNYQAHKYHKCY